MIICLKTKYYKLYYTVEDRIKIWLIMYEVYQKQNEYLSIAFYYNLINLIISLLKLNNSIPTDDLS